MGDAEEAIKTPVTTRLLFVRHGESIATVTRTLAGVKTCSGLSELGFSQAERLRDRFAAGHERAVDAVWASPVRRALQTGEIVNEAIGAPFVVDPDLEEHRPGAAEGMRFDEAVAAFGPPPADGASFEPWQPGGESRSAFGFRLGTALHRIVDAHMGQTVLVACHGGVIDSAMRQLLQLPSQLGFDHWALNTAITEFSARHLAGQHPGRWNLNRYNDAAHHAGLPPRTEKVSPTLAR